METTNKTDRVRKRRWRAILFLVAVVIVSGLIWKETGLFGLNLLLRGQVAYWSSVELDSPRLTPAMRLALASDSACTPGEMAWQEIGPGFEVGELPALLEGQEVDRILLARVDPARFRFAVLNDAAGCPNLDQWMAKIHPVLVVNGSYYSSRGTPDTPFLSNGVLLGPADYDAKEGAFISSPAFTGIRDLSHEDWKTAFQGADNALVSYPLLIANGAAHSPKGSRWLANRSFVGEDAAGRVLIGTTKDAYFSLDRLARFLAETPLGLTRALNLDGGPVACQGISFRGYERRSFGHWELQATGQKGKLLTWLGGQPAAAMPIVLAVFPQDSPR